MLRLLIDQDLDHVILRGLLLRVPNADVITAKIESYRGVLKDRDILKARIGAAISSMNNH